MITYGLEARFSQKVFKSNKTQLEPDDITSYAFVGLGNFYSHHPDKFESRLSKGPPPCYRWLAWRFMSKQVLAKNKGEYESMLHEGVDGPWLHDIDKDLGRTYPAHPLFDVQKSGVVG
jgi:hypothetical protein